MASVPTPASIVPQIRVVGPPFKKAEPTVKLIPVHEDSTVMPNATAGFNERYLFMWSVSFSEVRGWQGRALRRVFEILNSLSGQWFGLRLHQRQPCSARWSIPLNAT